MAKTDPAPVVEQALGTIRARVMQLRKEEAAIDRYLEETGEALLVQKCRASAMEEAVAALEHSVQTEEQAVAALRKDWVDLSRLRDSFRAKADDRKQATQRVVCTLATNRVLSSRIDDLVHMRQLASTADPRQRAEELLGRNLLH
ncbi:hypothetical protein DIPPA_32962 [Diplonema papillatum]|nr:hypothetical protein DIPPA_32962 [Diplonema papillatum]|eukprot:gene5464-8320_t